MGQESLEIQMDPARVPSHVAIIMDGNGRWASRRGLPRIAGHRAGADAVRRTVAAAARLGVGTLTLYAFSADNWKRPPGAGSPLRRPAPRGGTEQGERPGECFRRAEAGGSSG
jgi:undecaprenyl pyrophosphate synthase